MNVKYKIFFVKVGFIKYFYYKKKLRVYEKISEM